MSLESPEANSVIPFDGQRPNIIPYPRRRPDLAMLAEVRREAVRVYREVRLGKLESTEGTRLIYMLNSVGKLIEATEAQARVEALERAVNRRMP